MDSIFEIYLPIAHIKTNVLLLIATGIMAGLMGGIFGLGGGLIVVPLLVFMGISANVAVATSASVMVATALSSCLGYSRQKRVDYKLGLLMLIGTLFGVMIGILIFNALIDTGKLGVTVSFSFLTLLLFIGLGSIKDIIRILKHKRNPKKKLKGQHYLIAKFPLKTIFTSSKNDLSIIAPVIIGACAGIFVSLLGIGGGIIMLPAMLYLLRIDETFITGTSHFQMIFAAILATTFHSITSHSVDVVLSVAVLLGSAFGAQVGVRINSRIHADHFRILFAIIVFLMVVRMAYSLLATPNYLYSIERIIG